MNLIRMTQVSWLRRPRAVAWLILGVVLTNIATAEDAKLLPWLTTLEAGRRDAQLKKRPLLVRFGAEYCPWCRRLDEVIAKPSVQKALRLWTLVEIDTQNNPADARALDVEGIPALRVVLPSGRLLESQDGFLPEEDLIEWLENAFEKSVQAPQDVLFASGPPAAPDLKIILQRLEERESAIREAAIRRLLPFPKETGAAVVAVLKQEKLSARLAAYELLQEWKAPLDEMDPWRQESMTAERYARVDEWLASVGAVDIVPATLPEAELPAIRDELDRMLKTDAITAAAIRERLARYKAALLPEITSRLKDATQDESRSRLVAMRYRLVMQDTLALEFPGLVDRLAAIDVKTRQTAVLELSENANPETQPLFLELFTDPDPRVRELSLLGLRSASGDEGTVALVKLLDDPEPNVRAAVLKIFAEDPWPGLRVRLAEYLKTEQDSDLIVHAVRCFRKLKSRTADDLLPLLKHPDWRVRAETLDTLTGNWQRYPDQETKNILADQDVRAAVKESLHDEDPFVVGRAILGIGENLTTEVVKTLIELPAKHSSLTKDVVEVISHDHSHKELAFSALMEFYKGPDPSVRAAAIAGLGQLSPEEVKDELIGSLEDASPEVRIAGAKTLLKIMKQMQPPKNSRPGRVTTFGTVTVETSTGMVEVDLSENDIQLSSPATDAESGDEPKSVDQPIPKLPGIDIKDVEAPDDQGGKPAKKSRTGIFGMLNSLFGGSSQTEVQVIPDQSSEPDESDDSPEAGSERDEWLNEFRSGEKRPRWLNTAIPPLEKMFASPNRDEQVASAAPLVALGVDANVLPRVIEIARTEGGGAEGLLSVLEWLPFDLRTSLARQFIALPRANDYAAHLLHLISQLGDSRDGDLMWTFAEIPHVEPGVISTIEHCLKQLYFNDKAWNISQVAPTRKKQVEQIALAQLSEPRSWRHVIALALLHELSPAEEGEADERIRAAVQSLENDPALDADLKADAFQMGLILSEPDEQNRRLMELLGNPDEALQLMAIKALLNLSGGVSMLAKSHISFNSHRARVVTNQSSDEIQPELPNGLGEEQVRPLMNSKNAELKALGGYVLALCGDDSGMATLLEYWRRIPEHEQDEWDRLVYRAIAALDDSSRISFLKQIYNRIDDWRSSEFYWTIRIMTGPELLEFRKQIRKEKAQFLSR